jgi:protein SCO1/2
VRLADFRGQAVGLTFIFTRCPLPDFCPRMLKNFSTAGKALANAGAPTNWHFLTLTIDPQFDTPAVLKTHAERQRYDPAHWSFLTGAMIEIDALTEQVGLDIRRQSPTALPEHNLRTVVIDAEGRLRKVFVGNLWTSEELVDEMQKAARPDDPALSQQGSRP